MTIKIFNRLVVSEKIVHFTFNAARYHNAAQKQKPEDQIRT